MSKLLGRKSGRTSGNRPGKAGQKESDNQAEAAGQPADSPASQGGSDPVFGLKFVFDDGASRTFTQLPVSIGRDQQNDIVLNDDSVSTMHARVYYDEEAKNICILDHDSLNGLFIDSQPTRRNVLYDGVTIRFGNVSLTFRDTGYIHPS